ncbi:MAG: hypothetical protein MUC92_09210 [Fimbriimonadaceae bacterium]|jgi:hypothetical protein|nr:hypothetical protein [Fimbriimonadaceae bacterium]
MNREQNQLSWNYFQEKVERVIRKEAKGTEILQANKSNLRQVVLGIGLLGFAWLILLSSSHSFPGSWLLREIYHFSSGYWHGAATVILITLIGLHNLHAAFFETNEA